MTTDDERFPEFLAREAHSYNAPPAEVPREEMWAAIGERRTAVAPQRRHLAVWIAMAATLVIGVAIGRYTLRRDADSGTARTALATSPAGANGSNGAAGGNIAYRLAARDHLARAEALLTAYRTSDSLGAPNTQITEWAQDVLQNTRLLLDSPAAADPSRQQLLRDLEAVLVQMIQRSPGPVGAEESRVQVYRSIERTHVLTRLRSAQPVGLNGSN